jgi:hypothetical protein
MPDEVLGQFRKILQALSEWRKSDRGDVNPVKKVSSEATGCNERFQVRMSRSQNAHFSLARLRFAYPTEFARLQEPQEQCLESRRHFGEFVQEESSTVRGFDVADPLTNSAGEGAGHVSEECVFEQALRNSSTIDDDEGPASTERELKERPRDHLLANPCLSQDED